MDRRSENRLNNFPRSGFGSGWKSGRDEDLNNGMKTNRYSEKQGFRNRGRESSANKYGKFRGFLFLENLLKNDAEEIILTLRKERTGFLQFLETKLTSDGVVLVVKILKKICSSHFDDTKYTVIHSSLNEKFINQLRTFIACLPTQDEELRRNSGYFWKDPEEFVNNLLEICEDILKTTPTFGCKTLPLILNSLKIYVPILEQVHQIKMPDEIKMKVEKNLEIVNTLKQDIVKLDSEKNKTEDQVVEPPDDFRQISVYPSPEEVVGGRGFLRKNVVKGPYQNVDHYLDVQFRLLREDFVGPLRDGINSYRSSGTSNQSDNVKVHKGVRFLNTEIINEYYCLRVQFGSKKKKLNFENSRRFMFGCLLCFTKDNFKSLIFGKVAQRKVEDMAKGQVIVAFDKKLNIPLNTDFLMVECSVFFEPYFHVLNVLKNMSEENFPLERYIIRVKSSVQPPEYLTVPDCNYTIEYHEFNPLSDWPNENFYDLNDSQLVAFKAALTQEIAVIQGPPGTGKTYLGLRVVQTLLENEDCWYDRTPILVICFTNHALDQFLEGLLPYTKNIIRVGGQSKNTALDSYNLRNRHEQDAAVKEQRIIVQRCLREIKQITEILEQIGFYNSVLSFNHLGQVIQNFSTTWFCRARNNQIIEWLLEGAELNQNFNLQGYLDMIQVQAEFGNIGFDDDYNNDDYNETNYASQFDNIFEEVLVSNSDIKSCSFVITLKSMRDQLKEFEDVLAQLRQEISPSLQQQIREETLNIQLFELKQKYEYLKAQLTWGRQMGDAVREPNHVNLTNPHKMAFQDRWALYFYWLNEYKNYESDALKEKCEDFPEIYKVYEQMREMEDLRAMKDALVVGMTTTSAARLRSSLQTLKNPIVVVEEAAEVLEAHIVTSVTKHCKHLVLIGDHKQLKPNTASFNVEKQYQLGISLFERMIINNIYCYTLNVQHRMRPEISSLIRPTVYAFLEDHPSVHQRPPITGIDSSIFFISHNNREQSDDNSSKTNIHEVTFLIYLARHLVLNGYSPDSITILTAYLGQFFLFQREKKQHLDLLKNMRIAVLDNYQGEESDIILLSLVRNNEENKIGFLSIENRVCVALSRAKNGLYIMGNMEQLCHASELWRKIKASLEERNALGSELALRCQIHHDQITRVKCETDFLAISEGGCSKKCEVLLKCGHKCASLCHIQNQSHAYYKCQLECKKNLCKNDETHLCKKRCFEECGACTYLVPRTLPCGHDVNIECHLDPETYKCLILVTVELPCGHTATEKPCYCDPETYRCPHMCDIQVESCGHACENLCHIRRDPHHLEYQCRKPCTKFQKNCSVQEDDHRCRRMCYQECDECKINVRKQRTCCPHFYDVPCSSDVDELICEKPCVKLLPCGHPCKNKCNQECQVCQLKIDKVVPICGHTVKVKCNEPPNRKYCNKKCPLKLPCGHPCLAKCNEPCTTICSVIVSCPGVVAECGHVVTRIKCSMMSSEIDPKVLVEYCTEPCRTELKCGHLCSGSCGECLQGRIHKRCTQKCGAVLVCDHTCDIPCRQACRPCKRKCSYRCVHSTCGKSCGEVCTPCRERCPRNCAHQRCRRFCGDICDVAPCTEPCKRQLRCGHRCVGFCGDPCPPKCLICDKDELLEIFFGTESEDARYVILNDCKHIVESEGMEHWLQLNENQISYKSCPKCKTAIKTTPRYSDYIKRALMDITQVKLKTNGKQEAIPETKKELVALLSKIRLRDVGQNLYFLCPKIDGLLTVIKKRLQTNFRGRRQPINIFELQSMKSKLQIAEHVINICRSSDTVHSKHEIFFPQVNFIFTALNRDQDSITDQEIDDINSEITRLLRMVEFSRIQKSSQFNYYASSNETAKKFIADIEEKIFACKQFTKEDNENLKQLLKGLTKTISCGVSISDTEKREILRAMGFSKGHWFKCPNGHVYAIGECGGAMEESKCYECGAKIGGTHHRLLADNAVATEMDGAVRGAWSERANLLNYNIRDYQ